MVAQPQTRYNAGHPLIGGSHALIILNQLDYNGECQHATAKWTQGKTTDWVTPTTPPIELGYGRGAE
jgi:hypothetical protein